MNIRYVALRLVLAALLLWGIFCGIGHLLGKGATPLDQLSVEGRVGRRGRGALVRPELGPVPHMTGQPTGARVGRTR